MDELVWLKEEGTEHQGRICVRDSYTHHSEPIMIRIHWPASDLMLDRRAFEIFPEIADGKAVQVSGSNGRYGFSRGYGSFAPTVVLPQLEQTKSIKTVEEPILPPKVRKGIALRWHNGAWQKCLKTTGWTYAY